MGARSIALLALAAGAVRVSTAAFTSTTSSQAGDLVAGTLQLQSPASGLVLLDASNMKRGETRYADVTLTASGNVTAFWSVELKGAPSGSAPLAHALILTIAKDAGSQHTQTLYKGPLDGLTRTTVGSSEPGVGAAGAGVARVAGERHRHLAARQGDHGGPAVAGGQLVKVVRCSGSVAQLRDPAADVDRGGRDPCSRSCSA